MYCDIGVDDDGRTTPLVPWTTPQLMHNYNRRIVSCLPQGIPLLVSVVIVTVTARLPTPWLRLGSTPRSKPLMVALRSQELIRISSRVRSGRELLERPYLDPNELSCFTGAARGEHRIRAAIVLFSTAYFL